MNKLVCIIISAITLSLINACGDSTSSGLAPRHSGLSVNLQLPGKLSDGSGGNRRIAVKLAEVLGYRDLAEACDLPQAAQVGDPFRNGYEMSRFTISTMAIWSCVADRLIDLAAEAPRDGRIRPLADQVVEAADAASHYSLGEQPAGLLSLRLYFGYANSQPPSPEAAAAVYISWRQVDDAQLQGRMIIDAPAVAGGEQNADAPTMMRMDFDFDGRQRSAELFLRFDDNNPGIEGLRIQVSRDETANPLERVFTARGLINMTRQLQPLQQIDELPQIQFFTVTDLLGNGAAIGRIKNMSLPLIVNDLQNNHLGNYLLSKRDTYFFEHDRDWEYIDKTVTHSQFRGNRNTRQQGGSWLPFDPSLDMVAAALALEPGYFTGNNCADLQDDCNQLLNAVFADGFAGQEKNQGSDPGDWRSQALATADYLDSIYPDGVGWGHAFAQDFKPRD